MGNISRHLWCWAAVNPLTEAWYLTRIKMKFLSYRRTSTIELLILLVTSYLLIARLEATIAVKYSQLTRVGLILYILDSLFGAYGWKEENRAADEPQRAQPAPRFKNLMT
jgi:hypothetical protein